MTFVKEDSHYRRYYDEFNVLLGTGMRVSEFCGLTKDDLDFENRRIFVGKQLVKENKGAYHVEKTKTESGVRYIPMTDAVYESLQNILKNRKKPRKEMMVDGYTGFILLDQKCNPKVALHLDHHMQWTMKKYRRTRNEPLPTITPHVLRHTFCTNMANAGMDLKSLQYLMGHSDAGVTMNVYTHASYAHAEQTMQKILKFDPQKEQKTG
jgi:integrase